MLIHRFPIDQIDYASPLFHSHQLRNVITLSPNSLKRWFTAVPHRHPAVCHLSAKMWNIYHLKTFSEDGQTNERSSFKLLYFWRSAVTNIPTPSNSSGGGDGCLIRPRSLSDGLFSANNNHTIIPSTEPTGCPRFCLSRINFLSKIIIILQTKFLLPTLKHCSNCWQKLLQINLSVASFPPPPLAGREEKM